MPPAHPNQVGRIESESFSFLNELARAFRSGESNPRPSHFPVLEGIRGVLAELQSAGRLIPAGGMALTAEQAEDVRTMLWSPGVTALPAFRRLRALFPATEPAAVRDGSDLVVVQRSHTAKAVQSWMALDLWTDLGKNDKDFDAEYERQGFGDLWATLLGEVRALVQATTPTPAEPAEEETKAEYPHRSIIHSSRTIKTVGEALSYAETALLNAYPDSAQRAHYAEVIAELLRDVARQRPVGSNGKYGELHTPTCGCEDGPASSPVAEEETKAEGSCTGSGGHYLYPCVLPAGHAGVHADSRGLRWQNPASSPVVPAPTETEWQTLDAVPADVHTVWDMSGDEYRRRKNGGWKFRYRGGKWKKITLPLADFDNYAPFVAAEEW